MYRVDSLIQTLVDEAALWLPRVIGIILIAVVFFVAAKIIGRLIARTAERLQFEKNLASLITRTSNIVLIIIGLVTVLGTLGIDVSALVAGLGLTGFALGFALKDTISNLLSGVLILLYRPFEIGNRIRIGAYEGVVLAIDMRYTVIDAEGGKVLIPNSKLFTDPITVLSGSA